MRLRNIVKTNIGLTVIIVAAILLQGISAFQYYYTRSLLAEELEKRAESEITTKVVIVKNALNMAAEEKEKGFTDAFVMKRGSMYYVCYGQYATAQEAKAVLPEVWKISPKAWILNKK